jgi:hypothetical protein
MNKVPDDLWLSLHPILDSFAKKIVLMQPSVCYRIDHSSNKSFLMRGHLSFLKKRSDDELAICFDAVEKDGLIDVSTDICMDSGEVLAMGPNLTINVFSSALATQKKIKQWLDETQIFLINSEPIVLGTLRP